MAQARFSPHSVTVVRSQKTATDTFSGQLTHSRSSLHMPIFSPNYRVVILILSFLLVHHHYHQSYSLFMLTLYTRSYSSQSLLILPASQHSSFLAHTPTRPLTLYTHSSSSPLFISIPLLPSLPLSSSLPLSPSFFLSPSLPLSPPTRRRHRWGVPCPSTPR